MANAITRVITWMRGARVGEDALGNVYYQDRNTPDIGRRRRWVIYADGKDEASRVPPAHHAWLHYTIGRRSPTRRRPIAVSVGSASTFRTKPARARPIDRPGTRCGAVGARRRRAITRPGRRNRTGGRGPSRNQGASNDHAFRRDAPRLHRGRDRLVLALFFVWGYSGDPKSTRRAVIVYGPSTERRAASNRVVRC
jgi:NADH:ubiquinone oxidoreductase subunit